MARPRVNDPLTAEHLHEALLYDSKTGLFTWRVRPREHFQTAHGWNTFNSKFAGKRAGCPTKVHGCIQISINGRLYLAHRLAWFYIIGDWPPALLDHRDLNPANNRFKNLRLANDGQNQWNQGLQANNTSGYKGVSWAPRSLKHWWAQITCEGVHHNLGNFDTAEEAAVAYRTASIRLHGGFARHR